MSPASGVREGAMCCRHPCDPYAGFNRTFFFVSRLPCALRCFAHWSPLTCVIHDIVPVPSNPRVSRPHLRTPSVNRFPEYELRPGGADTPIDAGNVGAYVAAVVEATLGVGIARQVLGGLPNCSAPHVCLFVSCVLYPGTKAVRCSACVEPQASVAAPACPASRSSRHTQRDRSAASDHSMRLHCCI